MQLCLFEDDTAAQLRPLSWFRPVWELRCGAFSLRERTVRLLGPGREILHARAYLRPVVREAYPGAVPAGAASGGLTAVNGRLLMTEPLASALRKERGEVCYAAAGVPVEVIPGITAIQALAAAHRIPLNRIAEAVTITTGRKLAAWRVTLPPTSTVEMTQAFTFKVCPAELAA